MRASVHIKAPNLTKDGQADPHGNSPTCKAICDPLGLSVRGTGGEHTPIGSDGTIDLSPRARLFIKESEIVAKLYQGIKDLMAAEKAAGEAAAGAAPAEAASAEAAPAEAAPAEAAPAEAEVKTE
jgi:creatine kinase